MAFQYNIIFKVFIILTFSGDLISAHFDMKTNLNYPSPYQQQPIEQQLINDNPYNYIKYPAMNDGQYISEITYPRIIYPIDKETQIYPVASAQMQKSEFDDNFYENRLNRLMAQREAQQQYQQQMELLALPPNEYDIKEKRLNDMTKQNNINQIDDVIESSHVEPLPKPEAVKNEIPQQLRKKNSYYMSLCHLKICNMGRKRNTRYLHL